ncbi:MAG: hypothetical protein IJT97_03205 [Bacteroidaceae bacterium]|nr:hypothetical protein [Bacteroidaceae bacterium]
MIYLKLILACLLSAVPFFYASYIRPKKDSSSVWRNMFTAIGTQMPRLRAVKIAVVNFIHKLYEGMKRSDNFRKFFSLIVLLLMIAVQFVDFSASTAVARMVQDTTTDTAETANIINIYGPLMTRPHATILAASISLTLFSYISANWILTRLHNRKKFFLIVANLALLVLLSSPRYFIVAEILELLLMAALIYPDKITQQEPKGRKRIPDGQEQRKYRKAA